MKFPRFLFIGICIYCILFFIYINFIPIYYDDPDSFYYDSIGKNIEKPDNILFGHLLYEHGSKTGMILIFIFSLFIAVLIWVLCMKKDPFRAEIASLYFLYSPFIFFQNSWFQHLDKNMSEIFFFMMILVVILKFYDLNRISSVMIFSIMMIWVTWLASIWWQGYIIYIVYLWAFIGLYEYVRTLNVRKSEDFRTSENQQVFVHDNLWHKWAFWLLYYSVSILFIIMIMKRYPAYMILVAEGRPDVAHYIIPEFIIFFLMMWNSIRSLARNAPKIMVMSIIVFVSVLALPRLTLFMVPLTGMMYAYSDLKISRNIWRWIIIALIAFAIPSLVYLCYDHHQDIRNFPNPCKTFNMTNCVIISDWSYGHLYHNIWNETIYFIGHPINPYDMLDYMYYKNKSCDKNMNCTYLWHPRDYAMYDQYVSTLKLEKINQTIRKGMYAEIR